MDSFIRPKILAVDDRADNIIALEAILKGEDLELCTAKSGKEALQKVLENDFALILLDVQMPEMDGFETAELIRGIEKSLLFLSALPVKSEVSYLKAMKQGLWIFFLNL